MKSRHVKKHFLKWVENSCTDKRREEIQSHLKTCTECHHYYQKMSDVLQNPDLGVFPRLEPDRYLPTRIRAGEIGARSHAGGDGHPSRLTWSLAGLLILLAIGLGIIMGSAVFRPNISVEEQLAGEYYQAFTQNEISYQLDSIFDIQNGDEK